MILSEEKHAACAILATSLIAKALESQNGDHELALDRLAYDFAKLQLETGNVPE